MENFVFKNIGFLSHTFEEEQLLFLRQEVNEIKSDFSSYKHRSRNKDLAGNIQYEFSLIKSKDNLFNLLMPYLSEYENNFNYIKSITPLDASLPIVLDDPWVNFQKKNEYNPVHSHMGIISFVIYLDVPYNIEDEKNNISSINSNSNYPGHFAFLYTNSLGQIVTEYIPVDKSFRNVMLMFPAAMKHSVNPFYTSDDYRISVSGNFVLSTKQ
jgi:hypothetical protein